LASRVNGIGTSGRYCTTGSNGPTAWADNIGIHEVGHLWGLNHVENGNRFYESRPVTDFMNLDLVIITVPLVQEVMTFSLALCMALIITILED